MTSPRYIVKPRNMPTAQFPFMVVDDHKHVAVKFAHDEASARQYADDRNAEEAKARARKAAATNPRDHRIATPKAFQTAIPVTHTEIGGGYSYALLRAGAILRHPSGREVYFQPGDDTTALTETINAFDEISTDTADTGRAMIVDMALGDYFA